MRRLSSRLLALAASIAALLLAYDVVASAPVGKISRPQLHVLQAGVGVGRSIQAASQYVPTWKWEPTLTGVIPSGATFTRASSSSCWNASGVLVTVSTNVPCFDFDPATLQPLGYRAVKQSTNSLLRSEDFTNAAWTASGLTATTAQGTAPDGNNTLNKLVESGANAAHKVSQAVTLTTATNAGFSWFCKASSRSKFYISVQASTNNYATAIFDTVGGGTTASQTSTGSGSGTVSETLIRNVGGGIYRISLQARVTGANPTVALGLASLATGNTVNTTGDVTYAGDGASFGYCWGAQFDTAGSGVSPYIPTAGSTVTRSQDLLSVPLASVPGWDANKGGVLVATYRLHTNTFSSTNQNPADITDGGTNNVQMEAQSGAHAGNNQMGLLTRATTGQINVAVGGVSLPFVRKRQTVGWGTSRGQIAADGVLLATSSGSFLLPVGMTAIYPGGFTSAQLDGTLESIAYYAGARSDAFVQQVSR